MHVKDGARPTHEANLNETQENGPTGSTSAGTRGYLQYSTKPATQVNKRRSQHAGCVKLDSLSCLSLSLWSELFSLPHFQRLLSLQSQSAQEDSGQIENLRDEIALEIICIYKKNNILQRRKKVRMNAREKNGKNGGRDR